MRKIKRKIVKKYVKKREVNKIIQNCQRMPLKTKLFNCHFEMLLIYNKFWDNTQVHNFRENILQIIEKDVNIFKN